MSAQYIEKSENIIIGAYGYEIIINPQYGGRIDSFTYKGQSLFRKSIDFQDSDPLQSACFPLVPFSNRIRNGAFMFEGNSYKLRPNWDGDQPNIHGQGWQKPWRVIEASDTAMVMAFHGDGWWPWAFEAKQYISLSENGAILKMTLQNLSDSNMPAGLGFHPYFNRTDDTILQCNARKIWNPMQENIALNILDDESHKKIGFDGKGRNINNINLDHCFEDISGNILIKQASRHLTIMMQPMRNARHMIIYIPDNAAEFFCAEPVSHITGAISDDVGHIDILKPGQSLDIAVKISAQWSE